ncbi:hypothetical protein QM012_007535 [Aureobasidium pullulans]|uniref:Uncharacterized protein n=1 Tax=Aureobasidium pullulans TaxID=5580 RepID=A0ABR0TN72_AURPU
MWIHINCYCRLCAGRNIPSGSPVSPLSPSFHNYIGFDSPPSPLSPALSFTSTNLPLPSPVSPLLIATEDWCLSPISPLALEPFSPTDESSAAPASPTLSIAELTPRDFPSPATPLNTAFLWDLCIIPTIPADFSVFAPNWRDDTSHPFDVSAQKIDDEAISPTTLPNGKKAIRSSPALPPLLPRPISRRPKRSPLLTSKFSWGSTPTTSPSVASPNSLRFNGPIYTFETVTEEVKSKAGSLYFVSSDSVSIHTLSVEVSPLIFENKPWWENIPDISPLPSPVLISGFSGVHGSPTPSSPSVSPTTGEIDIRNVYWTSVTPQTAAEYLAIFGVSVFEDEFAWIRYPIPGPHDLCYSDNENDDETAGYDWDHYNPTAFDTSDPFSDVDDVFALYADSLSSSSSLSSSASWSFEADDYSGLTDSECIAMTAETARASYISSFLSDLAVAVVKEVCVEDREIGSLDLVISSIF